MGVKVCKIWTLPWRNSQSSEDCMFKNKITLETHFFFRDYVLEYRIGLLNIFNGHNQI